jgi:hypothetical protein
MGQYSYRDGLLYKDIWDPIQLEFQAKAVVPRGGLRAFRYNGRMYRLPLRRQLLLLYHDSESVGAHASAADTLAKLSRMFFWPGMEHDVQKWVASCSVCRLVRPTKALTPDARMELYDRPFRILGIDDLGPISPPSEGNSYILHAECAFSHYIWLKAAPDNGAATWARFLVEGVMFDLAGFVPVLRSDRGSAFVSDIVAQICTLVNTEHCFGSSYHPQSQGFVEARHQKVNRILASYASSHPESWSRWLPLAQWCMRATPLSYRGNRSPYEIITGMLPQGPIDEVFRRLEPGKSLDPGSYVRDLVDNLASVHRVVGAELKAVHDKEIHAADLRSKGEGFQNGDIVVLRAPPQMIAQTIGATASGVSTRLLPRFRPQLFKVFKKVSPQAVNISDPDTNSTQLGFAQPIHVSRLRKFDLADLDHPIEEGPLSLELFRGSTWVRGQVVSQSSTGKVLLQLPDIDPEWVDLASEEYRWVYSVEELPALRRRLRGKTTAVESQGDS